MSLTPTHLSALQQAGAAVFAADAELKNAVRAYAERVTAAMQANPFGLGNDALFENWKRVARLSQTLTGIEDEMKKVYFMAEELMSEDTPAVQPVPTLAAPDATPAATPASAPPEDQLAPTDVRIKSTRKSAGKPARKAAPKAAPKKMDKPAAKLAGKPAIKSPAKPVGQVATPGASVSDVLSGNAGKLLQHLKGLLNNKEFLPFNQSASSQATGIPLGSMTAALRKLVSTGYLNTGPGGRFKLVIAR